MSSTGSSRCHRRLTKTFSFALTTLLLFSLLFSLPLPTAYAVPTSAEKQAEADEASATLAAAEAQMEQIGVDYRAAVEAHDAAEAAMEEAQARIEAAEAIISDTQDRLGVRANQMYRDGQLSFLEVIFGASSFEAFTAGWDLINTLNEQNAELIQANKDARTEAQAAHAEYTLQEEAAAAHLAEVTTLKTRAEELVAEQQALLNSLDAEVAALVDAEQAARYASRANENSAGINIVPRPVGSYGSALAAAADRVGCAYVSGGSGPDIFDCSGLTSWAYAQVGRSIGRNDTAQRDGASGTWPYTGPESASPGDILWWPGHVALYAGGGSYIHAANPNQGVCYSDWDIENALVCRY